MTIAQSFSNFLKVTQEDETLFELGEPSYNQAALGMVEVGPITIAVFSDLSSMVLYKEGYWVADSPDAVVDILLHLTEKHPYLLPAVIAFNEKVKEATA